MTHDKGLPSNPFDSPCARARSCYTRVVNGKLIQDEANQPAAEVRYVHDQLRGLVLAPDFVCVGAKIAISTGAYRFGLYPQMGSMESTKGLVYDLYRFQQEQATMDSDYTTFIASFLNPRGLTEKQFERLLWRQLKNINSLDAKFFDWDSKVSSNPNDSNFGFSVAEQAFFVAGLHAGSAEWSRVFGWPTLVFNTHAQFERLRQDGKFDEMKKTIRHHEYKLQGRVFPNAADHGEVSEALQYSGRLIEKPWVCPVHFTPKKE